jgi:GGDEF domain-containing protein
MVVLDLSSMEESFHGDKDDLFERLLNLLKDNIREIDKVAAIDDSRIALLFPETSRQGAEVVSRRIMEQVKEIVSKEGEKSSLVPMEMVSYPDAAGARSMSEFLEDLVKRGQN